MIVKFTENGSATILGRLCVRDATGALSPNPAEGNLCLPVDLASLRVEVYDVEAPTDASGNRTPTFTATPSPASCVQTTLQTSGVWLNIFDGLGGNFLFDLPATAFPRASTYSVEVKATTTGGTVGWGRWSGPARAVYGS